MKKSKEIALCGVFAALAIVIMCFGGMIPFMTYVCPVICILIEEFVYKLCGKVHAWSWYIAVCILAFLMCPDKEAAAIFVVFGYYPVIKQNLDGLPVKWLFKLLYFNAVTLALYWILMHIMGMDQLTEEFSSLGAFLTVIMLLMGNFMFLMIDKVLERINRKFK